VHLKTSEVSTDDRRFAREVVKSPIHPFRLDNALQRPHGFLCLVTANFCTEHQSKLPHCVHLTEHLESRSVGKEFCRSFAWGHTYCGVPMITGIPRVVVDNDVEGQRGCDGGE